MHFQSANMSCAHSNQLSEHHPTSSGNHPEPIEFMATHPNDSVRMEIGLYWIFREHPFGPLHLHRVSPRRSLDLAISDPRWMTHSDFLELMKTVDRTIQNYKTEPLHGSQPLEETIVVSGVAEDPAEESEASTSCRSECASQTDDLLSQYFELDASCELSYPSLEQARSRCVRRRTD
jgi:hypothetical protein